MLSRMLSIKRVLWVYSSKEANVLLSYCIIVCAGLMSTLCIQVVFITLMNFPSLWNTLYINLNLLKDVKVCDDELGNQWSSKVGFE